MPDCERPQGIPHATGALVDRATHLRMLASAMQRWENGDLSDHDAAALIARANYRMVRVCWCDSDEVCCKPHGRHVSPHRGCLLR